MGALYRWVRRNGLHFTQKVLFSLYIKHTGCTENKLTKLGRCDRYTIEGLIIGLLGLPGLLGVQDC